MSRIDNFNPVGPRLHIFDRWEACTLELFAHFVVRRQLDPLALTGACIAQEPVGAWGGVAGQHSGDVVQKR